MHQYLIFYTLNKDSMTRSWTANLAASEKKGLISISCEIAPYSNGLNSLLLSYYPTHTCIFVMHTIYSFKEDSTGGSETKWKLLLCQNDWFYQFFVVIYIKAIATAYHCYNFGDDPPFIKVAKSIHIL